MAETTELVECPRCGGAMEIDAEQLMFVCPYCGGREPLDDTTARRLNTETRKETTPDSYAAYVEKCIQAGFNQRYNRQDRRFYGYDAEGHALSVEYIGFNKMEAYAYTVTS